MNKGNTGFSPQLMRDSKRIFPYVKKIIIKKSGSPKWGPPIWLEATSFLLHSFLLRHPSRRSFLASFFGERPIPAVTLPLSRLFLAQMLYLYLSLPLFSMAAPFMIRATFSCRRAHDGVLRPEHAEGARSSSICYETLLFATVEVYDRLRQRWSSNVCQRPFLTVILGDVVFNTASSSRW